MRDFFKLAQNPLGLNNELILKVKVTVTLNTNFFKFSRSINLTQEWLNGKVAITSCQQFISEKLGVNSMTCSTGIYLESCILAWVSKESVTNACKLQMYWLVEAYNHIAVIFCSLPVCMQRLKIDGVLLNTTTDLFVKQWSTVAVLFLKLL